METLIPHPGLLSVLCAQNLIAGRDLVVFDDNAYLRGSITSHDCSKGIIRLSLERTHALRAHDGLLERYGNTLDVRYWALSLNTMAILYPDGSLCFHLSVSGHGAIILPDSAVPEYV